MSARPDAAPPSADLAMFRDPRSVAVVGASADPAKWGHWLAKGALAGRDRRSVHLVNRRAVDVLGISAAAALRDLPEVPELVAIAVPAADVPAAVDEALALGVRGFLIVAAGVPEQDALAARIAASGARLIGPSSLGLYDGASGLQLAWGTFTPGPLAVVSQSGQVGSEIAHLATQAGIGTSRFVSVGAQLDVTTAELLTDLAGHDRTRVVAVYLESFTDARQIFAAIRTLRAAGKPVCLLTAGASAAGRRAAQSHTGALTSPLDLVDAACRAAGAVRVDTPAQLVDLATFLLTAELPAGRKVAIVTDSGGQGALAADCASRAGLSVPELTPATREALAATLPAEAAAANPVDLAGAGERDLATYHRVTAGLLESGEVDALVLSGYFGRYAIDSPALAAAEHQVADQLGRAAARAGRPVVVHSMGADSITAAVLRDAGLPVYPTIEAAMGALAAAAALGTSLGSVPSEPVAGYPAVGRSYWGARELFAEAGVVFLPACEIRDDAEVTAATAVLRPPYVLKASWLAHKTEVGGVRLGLADENAVILALHQMRDRLGEGPYVLEEQDQRRDVVEIIVGARLDVHFGAMVTVGAGGTEAELYRDTVTECGPVDLARARAMIRSLRCAALLDGWRGRPAVDVEALAEVVVALSRLIGVPGVSELEINPVRVAASGAIAVDALITTEERAGATA